MDWERARRRKELWTRYSPWGSQLSDLLPPTRPHPMKFPPFRINLNAAQWINPLLRSETSWSNHLPKAPLLNIAALETTTSTQETVGDISDPKYNSNWLRITQLLNHGAEVQANPTSEPNHWNHRHLLSPSWDLEKLKLKKSPIDPNSQQHYPQLKAETIPKSVSGLMDKQTWHILEYQPTFKRGK
jgi:hypothetical protein